MSRSSPPHPKLVAVADRNGLGACRSVHPGLGDVVKASFGSIALGVALMSFLVLQPLAGPEYEDDPIMGIVLPVAGALFFVGGLVGVLVLRGRFVQVHDHGLVYKERGSISPIRFADVIAVRQDLTEVSSSSGTSFRGHLVAHLRSGARVRIQPNVEGIEQVTSALVRGSAPSVIADAVARLTAGQTLASGPVTLTPAGIQHKKRLLPYTSVGGVHERSKMSFSMNKTSIDLHVSSRDGGGDITVPAGAVLYRCYLEAIVDAMVPKAPPRPTVAVSFEVLQAHEPLDDAALRCLAPMVHHWGRPATVDVVWNAHGQLAPLQVRDETTGAATPASPELHQLATHVMALHRHHRTGVNHVRFLAEPGDGTVEISTELLRA